MRYTGWLAPHPTRSGGWRSSSAQQCRPTCPSSYSYPRVPPASSQSTHHGLKAVSNLSWRCVASSSSARRGDQQPQAQPANRRRTTVVTVESQSIGGSSRASKLACWSTTLQRCLGGKSDRQRAAHLHGVVLKSELTEATARRDLTQGVNSGSSCHPHVQFCCDEASSGARPSGSLGCTGKSAASSQACPCGSAAAASHKGLCRCVCLSQQRGWSVQSQHTSLSID